MVGVILMVFGAIWFLQGVNVLPGSFMTGQIRWAVYGGIGVIVWDRGAGEGQPRTEGPMAPPRQRHAATRSNKRRSGSREELDRRNSGQRTRTPA